MSCPADDPLLINHIRDALRTEPKEERIVQTGDGAIPIRAEGEAKMVDVGKLLMAFKGVRANPEDHRLEPVDLAFVLRKRTGLHRASPREILGVEEEGDVSLAAIIAESEQTSGVQCDLKVRGFSTGTQHGQRKSPVPGAST